MVNNCGKGLCEYFFFLFFRCVCVLGCMVFDGKFCLNDISFFIIILKRRFKFRVFSCLSRLLSYFIIWRRWINIVVFDYDYNLKFIYFVDVDGNDIKKVFLNGIGMKVILKGM